MSDLRFVDTNLLVYAADASEPLKQPRALKWMSCRWSCRTGRLSFQVLQEYYVTVTQKLAPGMEREAARSDVRSLLAWRPSSSMARCWKGRGWFKSVTSCRGGTP